MDESWGRQASAGTWIRTRPAWALSAVLIAVVSVIGLGQYRYSRWTPLQRFYFPAYVRSTILDVLGVTKPGRYEIERGASGQPEIHGYTPDYLEASSPRRQQIEARLEQEGRRGAAAPPVAAH